MRIERTATEIEIINRALAFRAEIARKAAAIAPKDDGTFFIPNVPFGVKKEPSKQAVPRSIDSDYWHVMWFHDLVFGRTREAKFQPKIENIFRAVAREYGVSKLDLISSRRTKDVVLPRQIAIYLAKTMTGRSLPEIARRMGGRDHSTAISSVKKIERLLRFDTALAERIKKIRASL